MPSILEHDDIVGLGPNPVLNFPSKGSDIGEAQGHNIIMCFGLLVDRLNDLFENYIFHLIGRIMDQPNLQDFLFLLGRESKNRLGVLIVIHMPVGVVTGMDGNKVTIFVGGTLMKHHGHHSVAGFVNRDSIHRVRNVNLGGNFQGSVVLGPSPFHVDETFGGEAPRLFAEWWDLNLDDDEEKATQRTTQIFFVGLLESEQT